MDGAVTSLRGGAADAATHLPAMDCFATLAMTVVGRTIKKPRVGRGFAVLLYCEVSPAPAQGLW